MLQTSVPPSGLALAHAAQVLLSQPSSLPPHISSLFCIGSIALSTDPHKLTFYLQPSQFSAYCDAGRCLRSTARKVASQLPRQLPCFLGAASAAGPCCRHSSRRLPGRPPHQPAHSYDLVRVSTLTPVNCCALPILPAVVAVVFFAAPPAYPHHLTCSHAQDPLIAIHRVRLIPLITPTPCWNRHTACSA
jgi:hypothetical protein